VVVALTVVALEVLALPGQYAAQIDPATLRDLHSIGMSPALFASIGLVELAIIGTLNVALALLLFWRGSRDRMALFGALTFLTFGGVAGSSLDDITGGPSPLPSVLALRMTARVLVVVGQVAFIAFWYVFPSGQFVPRWTRWLLVPATAYWVAAAIQPDIVNGDLGILVFAFVATGVVAQIYRYRAIASPIEREQTKWVVYGLTVGVLTFGLPQIIQPLLPPWIQQLGAQHPAIDTLTFGQTWIIALALIPICVTVAIMRYRLWDIDVIIRRTLIYGSLTAILAGVYFVVVLAAQVVGDRLVHQTQPPAWLIVVTTLAIAALFTPLRRGIQRVIDRRFYRSRYDATRTVESFAATLRTELELSELREHLVDLVQETMRPAHVSLWLPITPPQSPSPRQ
jgi:hypothetical protein